MQKTLFLALLIACLAVPRAMAQNTVHHYAGTGSPGFVNGDTSIASFNSPRGLAIDASGNLFVVDGLNHCVRKIATDGTVSTYAGSGLAGYQDGPDSTARFREPYNICIDPAGNLYVSDFLNQCIRKISNTGMVSTVAGTGVAGYADGPDTTAQFNYPRGICIDGAGNLYVGDSWNHRIRKIDPSGNVSTYAGGGNIFGVQSVSSFADGPDTTARFYTPTEVSCDTAGNLYVADAFNHRIRKVDLNRVVSTVAGSGPSGSSGGGFMNGPGVQALFSTPTACFAARDGNIYVGAGSSHRVRRIDPLYNVSTFAGTGSPGFMDGPDTLATFNFPRATLIDYARNRMYVVDLNNNAIRYIQLGPLVALSGQESIQLEAYPNPFSSLLRLRAGGLSGSLEFRIRNSLGQEVFVGNSEGTAEMELELRGLDPGFYFLTVTGEGQLQKTLKLLKRD